MFRTRCLVVCSAFALAACEQSPDHASPDADVGTVSFDASVPLETEGAVSSVVDDQGGTLNVSSITVIFQPQSVTSALEVGLRIVEPNEMDLPSPVHSEIFELTPLETLLNRPALVRVEQGEGVQAPVLVLLTRLEGGLQAEVLPVSLSHLDAGNTEWHSSIQHFGVGYIADAVELEALEIFKDNEVVAGAIEVIFSPTPETESEAGSAISDGGMTTGEPPSEDASTSEPSVASSAPAPSSGVLSETSATQEPGDLTSTGETASLPTESSGTHEPGENTSVAASETSSPDVDLGCPPGTFVAPASDLPGVVVCRPCGQGSFSDQPNSSECRPWTSCEPGEVPLNQPSATEDRQCGASEVELAPLTMAINEGGIVTLTSGVFPVTLNDQDSLDVPLGASITLTATADAEHVIDTLRCVGQTSGTVHASDSASLSFVVDGAYDCSVVFAATGGVPITLTMSELGGYVTLAQSSQVCSATVNDGPGTVRGSVVCNFETAVDADSSLLAVNVENGYRLTSVTGDCNPTDDANLYAVSAQGAPACDVTFGACLPADVEASLRAPNNFRLEPNAEGIIQISRGLLLELTGDTTLTLSAYILGDQTPETTTLLVDGEPVLYGEGAEVSFDVNEFVRDTVYELTASVPWCNVDVTAPQTFRIRVVN